MVLHKTGQHNFISDFVKIKRFAKQLVDMNDIEPDKSGNFNDQYLAKFFEKQKVDVRHKGRRFVELSLTVFLLISKNPTS